MSVTSLLILSQSPLGAKSIISSAAASMVTRELGRATGEAGVLIGLVPQAVRIITVIKIEKSTKI